MNNNVVPPHTSNNEEPLGAATGRLTMNTRSQETNGTLLTGQATSAPRVPLHEILYADVSLKVGDRLLLGRVIDIYEDREGVLARVKHFNGEDWPLNPNVATLTVLGPFITTTGEAQSVPAKASREHGFYCPVRCWCDGAER
jgi:hypothetical protein